MPTTKVTTAERPEPADKLPKLKVADRCDHCNAQAFVRTQNAKDHILDFCSHHYNSYQASLIGQGFQAVEDKRDFINAKPMSGSVLAEAADTKGLDDDNEWD